jgi:serine protease Do
MSEILETQVVKSTTGLAARRQRYVILALMVFSLTLGIFIGAMVTRGVLADPDNRISLTAGSVSADSLAASFASASSAVEPAVVAIDTREGGDADVRTGKGSGVLVTSTGFILTNFHVVEGAASIRVRLADRREFDGKVVGQDRETDLAVVKITVKDALPFANFGDSDRLRVGDWVLAIGSPFGLEQTVTHGIISARERETIAAGSSPFQKFLQTDAAINPGNSGGPLVNLAGEVIGINTQIATRTGSFSGIGLALPSKTAVEIYNQLVTSGRVGRGFLGIQVGDVSEEDASRNGLENTEGVLVSQLTGLESPAAKAGIRKNDIITEINGERVRDGRDLIRRIGAMPIGTVVRLTYVREGQAGSATVKLTDREEGITASRGAGEPEPDGLPVPPRGLDSEQERPGLGISLTTLTPDLARDRNLTGLTGVLVLDVEVGSSAFKAGLAAGDVVLSVNGARVLSEADFDGEMGSLRHGQQAVIGIARRVGTRIDRRFLRVTVL